MSSDSSSNQLVNDLLAEYEVWCEETNQTELNEFLNSRSEHLQDEVVEALKNHLDLEHMLRNKFAEAGQKQTVTKSLGDERKPGLKIEHYRLLKKIGEGGFGIVYMADQTHPVRRRVAIKVAQRKTKPKESKEIIARFRHERQALALMDHENIARIFDAGTTNNGQPYFVMELVNGIPLTDYCDQNRLSINQRLELMISVCQAVQHAHQKGIIHRDLKPSNILVSEQNIKHLPKVIDFGLAKAMGNQLSVDSAITQFGANVGTPLYMSPEQAGVDPVDVDTRADVYSLGIILYELLTGITPLQRDSGRGTTAFELIQRIREEQPPTPSSQLNSSSDAIKEISRLRQTDPARLLRQVRGDLDCIVMSAIDKDRDLRYETTSELADDITRFLDFEPIRKRPPSVSYRVKKFARKNRGLVATAISFVSLLFVALAAITVFWILAESSRKQAEASEVSLQKSNIEKDNLINEKDVLIKQGSGVAIARGRDAWRELRPDDAIAHFVSALRMQPDNKTAARWLYHSLISHRHQGWNPPYFVIGGESSTKKAVLSQNGQYVVTQKDQNITIQRIVDRKKVIDSIVIDGTIEDLHHEEKEKFRLLTIQENSNSAIVWAVNKQSCEQVSRISGPYDEGELRFSNAAKYLVSNTKNSLLIDAITGERKTFDSENKFALSLDDSLLVVSRNDELVFTDLEFGVDVPIQDVPQFKNSGVPVAGTVIAPTPVPNETSALVPQAVEPVPTTVQQTPVEATPVTVEPQPLPIAQISPSVVEKEPPDVNKLTIVPASKPNFWISQGRPVATYPGSLVYHSNYSSKQFFTLFDLATGDSEITSFPSPVVGGCVDCGAKAASPVGNLVSGNCIYGPDGSLIRVESIGGPACGPGIDCSKNSWGVTFHFGDRIQKHWKKVRFPVYDATFDTNSEKVLLASRPLPSPTHQLFDFSNTQIDPPFLDHPSVEQLPNRLESHFLNGNLIVTNLAKNAVGIWAVDTPSIVDTSYEPKMGFDLSARLVVRSEPGQYNVKQWIFNKIRDAKGVKRNYREYNRTDQTTTRTKFTSTYKPVFSDTRPVNGGVLLYIAGEREGEPKLESRISTDTDTEPTPVIESQYQNDIITLDLLDTLTFNSNLSIELDFFRHTDRPIDNAVIDRSGDLLVVEGQGLVEQRPAENSILENAGTSRAPAPVLGVYQISKKEWLVKSWQGRFAAFHSDSGAIACISKEGAIKLYDVAQRDWNDTVLRADNNGRIAAVSIDPTGNRIAGVTEDGTLMIWKLEDPSKPPITIPNSGIPQKGASHPVVFDKSGQYVAINVDPSEPYYTNSPDCKDCPAGPVRAKVINWKSKDEFWVENTVSASRTFLLTTNNRGLNLFGIDSRVIEFGPLTFNQGRAFLNSDETLLVSTIKTENIDSESKRTKLEVWSTIDESPMAPTVELDAEMQVICCAFPAERVRVLCLDNEFKLSVVEIPLRTKLIGDNTIVSKTLLDWAESYAGRRVEIESGRVIDVKFSESREICNRTKLQDGAWNDLRQWLNVLPEHRPIWPGFVRSKMDDGKTDDVTKDAEPLLAVQEAPKLIPESFLIEHGKIVDGYEHEWGFLWQHEGETVVWTQTSKDYMQVHRLEELERTSDFILLSDKRRMLEIKLPVDSSNSESKLSFDRRSSQIRGWVDDAWDEWKDWHPVKQIPRRN